MIKPKTSSYTHLNLFFLELLQVVSLWVSDHFGDRFCCFYMLEKILHWNLHENNKQWIFTKNFFLSISIRIFKESFMVRHNFPLPQVKQNHIIVCINGMYYVASLIAERLTALDISSLDNLKKTFEIPRVRGLQHQLKINIPKTALENISEFPQKVTV